MFYVNVKLEGNEEQRPETRGQESGSVGLQGLARYELKKREEFLVNTGVVPHLCQKGSFSSASFSAGLGEYNLCSRSLR